MADEAPSNDPAGIDSTDKIRHGDDESIKKAKDKMKQAVSTENKTAPKDEKKEVIQSSLIGQVKVYTPYKVYFDGPANSVSAVNETGPFDILPGHKNFMTLLSEGDIIVRNDRGEEVIKTQSGIMHVSDDVVRVFLDV